MSETKNNIMTFFDKEIKKVEKKNTNVDNIDVDKEVDNPGIEPEEIKTKENKEKAKEQTEKIKDEETQKVGKAKKLNKDKQKETEPKKEDGAVKNIEKIKIPSKEELIQEIEEVNQLLKETDGLTIDELKKELKIYGYDVKEEGEKLYYLKDDKSVYPNITNIKQLKEILFEEKFKDGEYNPIIKEMSEIKDKIKNFNDYKFNLKAGYRITLSALKTLQEVYNIRNRFTETTKPIFKVKEEEISNKKLFNEAVTLVSKKWDMLEGIKNTEKEKAVIDEKIEKASTEKEKAKFKIEAEKLQFKIFEKKQEIKTASKFSLKYLDNEDFKNKQILKDEEKNKNFKETVEKVFKAEDFDEVKNMAVEVEEKINRDKNENLAFNTVLALCEKVINNIEETLNMAKELRRKIEEEISSPTYSLIKDITESNRNLYFQQKNEKKDKFNTKKEKKMKKNDTIMENILDKGEINEAKKSIRKL